MKHFLVLALLTTFFSTAYADNLTWFSDSQMTFDKSSLVVGNESQPVVTPSPKPTAPTNSLPEVPSVSEPIGRNSTKNIVHGRRFSVGEYSAELMSIAPVTEAVRKGLSPNECKDLYVVEFRPDAGLRASILKEMQFPMEANSSLPEQLRWIFGGRKGCFSRNTKTSSPTLESLDAALRRLALER